MSSGGVFVINNKNPSHFESNSWTSSFRRPIVKRSACAHRSGKRSVFREGKRSGFWAFFVPPDWFFLWSENYGWFCSVLKQSSHRVLQKFGIWIPLTDDEDINSSTWINQLHFLDPLHSFRRKLWTCKYLSLESYLPASKRGWCREFVEMKIWNLQSLLVCSIILWRVPSTEDDRIFGWLSRLASLILILCSPVILFHCGWMKRLFGTGTPWIQFLRIRCWRWRILDLQKRFPIYHVCPKCLAALLCSSAFL